MTHLTLPLMAECATWLSIVSQLYTARMNRLLEPHDLTLSQFSILNHLVRPELQSGTRISDIARAVEVHQPAVTKTIAKFEAMGLVTLRSDPVDKRARIVTPQPRADQLINQIRGSIGPDLFKTFSSIDDAHIQQFAVELKALGRWLDQNRI